MTILWIIRSLQGMLDKDDHSFWRDDWFLSALVTTLMVLLDIIFVALGFVIRAKVCHVLP